ncbi:MAG: hypothetical protein AAGJ08_08825 [Cyanobacteria bacterium P01_H01_bin.35]
MVFTDRAEWEAAVSSFSVETFDSFNGTDIKSQGLDVGDFTVTQIGQVFGNSGRIVTTLANSSPAVLGQGNSSASVNFMYDSSISAWGGDIRPGSTPTRIQILGVDYFLDASVEFGFFGILDDSNSFTEVDIFRGNNLSANFIIDNVSYTSDISSNPTSTPEPSLILSLIGLGGLVAGNKKKQK